MLHPKLNVQDPGQLWDKITSPEWSCPPTTPIECTGSDEYLTMNNKFNLEVVATISLLFIMMMISILIVFCIIMYFTQWQEKRLANRLVEARPEERVDILRVWCQDWNIDVEGTDLDLGEKRPLVYTPSGISHMELREDVEEQTWQGHEEFEKMEKMEKGPLI
jgi:hypothetical protein